MKPKRAIKLFIGITILVLYELLLDGSGVGMKERWNKPKGWSDR